MASTNSMDPISYAKELYDQAMSKGDPRFKGWLFSDSPLPAVTAMITYLFIVWIGPKIMQNRKPVKLGHILTVYNVTLVLMSVYMTYEFFMSAYMAGYSLSCQPVDYSHDPLALRMASVCWVYYVSKFVETLDTVFFILRKKNNQITFLHVYHHSTMIVNWYLVVKYIAGGATFFHALLNSFVHVVMYSYYAFSAFSPTAARYMKKPVTFIQVTQFVIVLFHSTNVMTRCDFPLGFAILGVFYAVSMITLFGNYAYQQYFKPRGHGRKQRTAEISTPQNSTVTNGATQKESNGKAHSE